MDVLLSFSFNAVLVSTHRTTYAHLPSSQRTCRAVTILVLGFDTASVVNIPGISVMRSKVKLR